MLTRLRLVALWLALVAGPAAAAQQPAGAPPGPGLDGPALPPVNVCGQQRAPLAQPPAG